MVHRFHYLKYALAAVLVFIGSKIFVADFLLGGEKFPAWVSLGVTFALIAAGILYSLAKTRFEPEPEWPADNHLQVDNVEAKDESR
jgi:tellurite resistance protein TerC